MSAKVLTRKQEEWTYQKWCEGYTRQEIADALHVCVGTVNRILCNKKKIKSKLECEWKNKRGKNDHLTKLQKMWIIQKWEERYQEKEIAQATGISRNAINRLCKNRKNKPALRYIFKERSRMLNENVIIEAIRTAIDEEGMAQVIAECEKQPSKGVDTCKKCRFRRKRPGQEIHGCLFHVCPMDWEI